MLGQIENTITEPIGKRTYSVAEVQAILGISRRKAYELCNSGKFKIIRIGRALRVSKYSFDYWLDHFEDNGDNGDNGGIENGINRQKR